MEDDIANHLHLCVALMSDPLTMRKQPGVVADHFITAMGKIEQLQGLLVVPNEPCAKHNWLGSSVLNSGVRRMVSLVLSRHMEPLRWKYPTHLSKHDGIIESQRNAAPQIFAKFEGSAHSPCRETKLAREIKEQNCMAALVLLYYYLHWHLLLILLNFRMHPCVGGHEVENRLDVDRLLKGLPAFFDTFELRPLRGMLNRDYNKTDSGDDLSECSSDGDNSEPDESEESETTDPNDAGPERRDDKTAMRDAPGQGGDRAVGRDASGQSRDEGVRSSKSRTLTDSTNTIKQKCTNALKHGALGEFMLTFTQSLIPSTAPADTERNSYVMSVYRMVLASTSAAKGAKSLLQNAHAILFSGTESKVLSNYNAIIADGDTHRAFSKHLDQRVIQFREKTIIDGLHQRCHSLSVFDLSDSVQAWFDACKPFEVKSLTPGQDAEDIDCKQKRYTCVLAEVMSDTPYASFSDGKKEKLMYSCIHDFNSTSLMMDVCGSFLKMHTVISDLRAGRHDDGIIKAGLMVFIMQAYASDKAMQKYLRQHSRDVIPKRDTSHEDSGLVAVPVGNFRKPAIIANQADLTDRLNMYELAGYYWGSKQADLNSVNHAYFAWPCAENGNYQAVVKQVQHLLNQPAGTDKDGLVRLVLSSGHRNSLFVSTVLKSLLAIIDALHCTALLDGSAITISENATVHRTKRSFIDLGDGNATLATQVLGNIPSPTKHSVSKQTLVDDLRAELSALSTRVERVRRGEFKLYTALSWPVIMGADGSRTTNHEKFELAGEMQLAPRTRNEYYLSRMAAAAELIVRAANGAEGSAGMESLRRNPARNSDG